MFKQYFETTLILRPDTQPMRFLIIPKDRIVEDYRLFFEPTSSELWNSGMIYELLGIDFADHWHFPSKDKEHNFQKHLHLLPYMLCSISYYSSGKDAFKYMKSVKSDGNLDAPGKYDFLLKSSVELSVSQVIPFSQSPLKALSLTEIIEKGSGVGIGASVGFLVAWGSPMLLISVPFGMILGGATAGIARGLEKGLEKKFLQMLGVESEVKSK